MYHVEIDLAAKTPKQDDSEEDDDPDEPKNETPITDNPNLQSLLNSVPQLPNESTDDFNASLSEIRKQFEQHIKPTAQMKKTTPGKSGMPARGFICC